MATEKTKEKLFRVELKRSFVIPNWKGQPKQGVIYSRGGVQFLSENGEGKSYHLMTQSEINEKLMLPKNQQFAISPLEYELDPNIVIEEVK